MEDAVRKLLTYVPSLEENFVVDWNGGAQLILPSRAKKDSGAREKLPPYLQPIVDRYTALSDDEVKSYIQFLEKHPSLLTGDQLSARIKLLDFQIFLIQTILANEKAIQAENASKIDVLNPEVKSNLRAVVELLLQILMAMKSEAEAAANPLGMSAIELGLGITAIVLLLVIFIVSFAI